MSKALNRIRDFLLISSKTTYPGFGRALGIDAGKMLSRGDNHIDNLVYEKDSDEFKFRYEIPNHTLKKGKLPLSGFLAVFDEVTTWAIVAKDRKGRPGVSISLYAEMGPIGLAGKDMNAGDVVQINARVVKSGQVLAFTEAEAVDLETGDVICTGRHVKYLPMPWITELVLSPLCVPLTKWITSYLPDKYASLNPTIDDLIQFEEISECHKSGRFHVESDHHNPMGSAHGGCQSMGIEMIGQGYADSYLKGKNPILRSIAVNFMSAGKKEIKFDADWIHVADNSASMSVKVFTTSDKPASEGVLHFVTDQKSKND